MFIKQLLESNLEEDNKPISKRQQLEDELNKNGFTSKLTYTKPEWLSGVMSDNSQFIYYDNEHTIVCEIFIGKSSYVIKVHYFNKELNRTESIFIKTCDNFTQLIKSIKQAAKAISDLQIRINAGEFKATSLSKEDITKIINSIITILMMKSDILVEEAFKYVIEKNNINISKLSEDVVTNILNQVENKVKKIQLSNPIVINALAKACLMNVLDAITKSANEDEEIIVDFNIEEEISNKLNKIILDKYTYSKLYLYIKQETGYTTTEYKFKDLSENTKDKIIEWVKNKVNQFLEDFK